jgi:hypothetical protein
MPNGHRDIEDLLTLERSQNPGSNFQRMLEETLGRSEEDKVLEEYRRVFPSPSPGPTGPIGPTTPTTPTPPEHRSSSLRDIMLEKGLLTLGTPASSRPSLEYQPWMEPLYEAALRSFLVRALERAFEQPAAKAPKRTYVQKLLEKGIVPRKGMDF